MAWEIVKVVEGMLRQAQQVLGLLFLELVRLNRDTQRKDWSAGLYKEDVSKPARTGNSQEGRRRRRVSPMKLATYPTVGPVHHLIQGQAGPGYCGRVPPYRQTQKEDDQPEG